MISRSADLSSALDELLAVALTRDDLTVRRLLRNLVPQYQPVEQESAGARHDSDDEPNVGERLDSSSAALTACGEAETLERRKPHVRDLGSRETRKIRVSSPKKRQTPMEILRPRPILNSA